MDTKNCITKKTKLISLQCRCKIIHNHVQSGTEFCRCLLLRYPSSDKIISDIYVFFLLDTWSSYILLQFDGDMVILIDNIGMDLVSILFQELSGPDHLGQYIVHSKNLGLSWTIFVQFLFYGLDIPPPILMVIKPPVWLLVSFCTKNPASMYHFILSDLSIDRINGRTMVPCTYLITLASFLY